MYRQERLLCPSTLFPAMILVYPTVTPFWLPLHWEPDFEGEGQKLGEELGERVQEIPIINWFQFRNLQGRLELTQETLAFCGFGQDGLNARINYDAIIGSVWRSMDIHYLCERVINNATNSTKLQKSGYLYFPFPCWLDRRLSVVRRSSVKCAGSSYTNLVPDVPEHPPQSGVPEGRAVLLPFRLR